MQDIVAVYLNNSDKDWLMMMMMIDVMTTVMMITMIEMMMNIIDR